MSEAFPLYKVFSCECKPLQLMSCRYRFTSLGVPSTYIYISQTYCLHALHTSYFRTPQTQLVMLDFLQSELHFVSHNSPFIRIRLREPLSSSATFSQPVLRLFSNTPAASPLIFQHQLYFISLNSISLVSERPLQLVGVDRWLNKTFDFNVVCLPFSSIYIYAPMTTKVPVTIITLFFSG